MISNKYVDEYINLWKQGSIIFKIKKELISLIIYKNIYIHEMMYILMNRKSRIVSNLLKNGIFQHYHFKGLS